jgi:environmental stress-induced protein Ves
MARRIVRYAQVTSTSWKNGLGLTRQLAIYPENASAQSFEWRLSIAQLTQTAPFSVFAGIERCLAVLEGAMTLQRAAAAALKLTPHSSPVCFSGEVEVSGVVEHGPVLDLNLMWQATRWQAVMRRLEHSDAFSELAPFDGVMLCSLRSALQLQLGDAPITLGLYDLLLLDATEGRLSAPADEDCAAYCIELRRR